MCSYRKKQEKESHTKIKKRCSNYNDHNVILNSTIVFQIVQTTFVFSHSDSDDDGTSSAHY
jgi:hypothetical protein